MIARVFAAAARLTAVRAAARSGKPVVPRIGRIRPKPYWRLREETEQAERQPVRPVFRSRSGMSHAQWLDYLAACEGRITWARYFQLWENGFSP